MKIKGSKIRVAGGYT